MTLRTTFVILAAVLALTACSGADKDDDDAKPVASVKTAVVQIADTPEVLSAYGAAEVAPSGERTLSAPMEAVVATVRVTPGESVEAGQPLIALTPSPGAAADITKAAADLDVASKAYARAQRLRASGLDSDADVEQARAAEDTAAETQRSLTSRVQSGLIVRAPSAGVVETLTATSGDLVAAGAALGRFGASGATRVHLGLEVSDAGRVRVGDTVSLRAIGDGGMIATGRVTAIESRIDPQTRLAGATVEVHGGLTLGQAVQGDIVLRTVHAPVAPRAAIVYDQDQPGLFVVSGGVAHRRTVALGPVHGDAVAVRTGLNAGERVVAEGAAVLDDGMAVAEAGAGKP